MSAETWAAGPAKLAAPLHPGSLRHAFVGLVTRGGAEQTCGHRHRTRHAARTCAEKLARRLNREGPLPGPTREPGSPS